MRDRLKQFTQEKYWVYGLSDSDLDYTVRIVETMVENNQKDLKVRLAQAQKKYPEEDVFCEVQSDLAHYAWVDEQYLWHFCLWRLQGIFEAMIIHSLLPESPKRRLFGLRAKLEAAASSGFVLSAEDYEELMLWADLRNALSHAPPEQYRPIPIGREDIAEYLELIKSILAKWRSEIPPNC